MAQVKEVKGPGGPPRAWGPRPKVENPGKLLRRIMDEVFRNYLPHCILVLICIVVSALANVQASLFLQTLMDDYIVPMTHQQNPSFAPLAGALLRVGCIYLVGILAAWINARVMVNVTQGTLRNLRTKLFTHMESLPISYFDTASPRRYHVRVHQRCRYPAPDDQPEHPAAGVQRHHHRVGVLQHVYAQLAADHRYHAHGGADAVLLQADRQQALLSTSSSSSGTWAR